jgi:CubicO group peptidase (beta-lactamase class C family)
MRTRRRPWVLSLIALATGLSSFAVSRAARANCPACVEAELAQIQQITTETVQNNYFATYTSYEDFAMMVVVSADEGILTTYVPFGYESRDAGARPVSPDTMFQIGSVTKTFTALMAAELDESGAMPLTSYLDDYIPSEFCVGHYCVLPTSGTGIRLVDLADMYSGLPRNAPPSDTTKSDFYNNVFHGCSAYGEETYPGPICPGGADNPPQEPVTGPSESCVAPGTVYNYSNFGYVVLSNVLSDHLAAGVTTGANFAEAVQSTVLSPLGMASTVLPTDGTSTPPYAASSYMCEGNNGPGSTLPLTCCPATTSSSIWPDPTWLGNPVTYGVGAMWTNAYDMGTWLNVHLDNTGVVDIPTNIRSAIKKNVMKTWETDPANPELGYGLAWTFDRTGLEPPYGSGVRSSNGVVRAVMSKGGDSAGFHSFVAMTPRAVNGGESGLGVAIMINYEPSAGVAPVIAGTAIRILQALENAGY